MPGLPNIPAVPKPTQNTGGPRPPVINPVSEGLALEPEFHQPYGVWKHSPSPQTNDMMLNTLKPIIDNAVKTYGGPDSPIIRSKAKMLKMSCPIDLQVKEISIPRKDFNIF